MMLGVRMFNASHHLPCTAGVLERIATKIPTTARNQNNKKKDSMIIFLQDVLDSLTATNGHCCQKSAVSLVTSWDRFVRDSDDMVP